MGVHGIGELVTGDTSRGPGPLGLMRDAAVVVQDGVVTWVGPSGRMPGVDRAVDAGGACVMPAFVDSHTHLVFDGDRAAEFTARTAGRAYDGGGIAASVAATRAASTSRLRARCARLVAEARAQGTGHLEIKSGYALEPAGEARLLAVAGEFTEDTTFLGAHVVPSEWAGDRAGYLDLVTGPMLAACAPRARWIDVFCEPGSPHAFDAAEARAVLAAGRAAGLGLRVHGNQLGPGPGVGLAVEMGAASVDHCTHLSRSDVDALAQAAPVGGPVATLLPVVEFSTASPYPDARALVDAGVRVALATDCNPGTCYSTSMPLAIALAVREMGLSPAEAVAAATSGGAAALRREDLGVIRPGARGELCLVQAPSHVHLAYRPGVPLARVLDLGAPEPT